MVKCSEGKAAGACLEICALAFEHISYTSGRLNIFRALLTCHLKDNGQGILVLSLNQTVLGYIMQSV